MTDAEFDHDAKRLRRESFGPYGDPHKKYLYYCPQMKELAESVSKQAGLTLVYGGALYSTLSTLPTSTCTSVSLTSRLRLFGLQSRGDDEKTYYYS